MLYAGATRQLPESGPAILASPRIKGNTALTILYHRLANRTAIEAFAGKCGVNDRHGNGGKCDDAWHWAGSGFTAPEKQVAKTQCHDGERKANSPPGFHAT